MRLFLLLITLIFVSLTGCVERGKSVSKEVPQQQAEKKDVKKAEHYICKNGHKGSDKQGVCPECKVAYTHNQAFHGLAIPKNDIKDPFQSTTSPNTASSPAQNAYGDYHYICPNGHSGGAGSAGNCTTCEAKLTHNQLYHK